MHMNATLAREVLRKLNPKWVMPATSPSTLRMIAVTCNDLDFITLAVLSEGHLGYMSEGDITFRLQRVHQ